MTESFPKTVGQKPAGVRAAQIALRVYQAAVSPLLWSTCRFHPTCSQYASEAVELHGVLRGSWLALRRLLRCRPFGGSGYDPVPLAEAEPGCVTCTGTRQNPRPGVSGARP